MEKIIIVTGDTSGIGKELCSLLSKDNIVYGISRREEECSWKHYSSNVLNFEELKIITEEIYTKHGRIDMVICSAGLGVAGSIELMDINDIDYQMQVNFKGIINMDKAVLPYMRKQQFGRIVHISSVAAVAPMPFQAMYSASKSAINTYSMALYNEVKPFGIDVVTVMPGDIKTGFTGARKKILDTENLYNGRVERSISKMEQDEINGLSPCKVAKEIYGIITKKRVKVLYTLGFSYKVLVFLMKILPTNFVNKVLYKMYAK